MPLWSYLPGDAILPIGLLPHLPLHEAPIETAARTARAPPSHFREVSLNSVDPGQGIG